LDNKCKLPESKQSKTVCYLAEINLSYLHKHEDKMKACVNILLMVVLLLFGCKNNDPVNSSTTPAKPSGKVSLAFNKTSIPAEVSTITIVLSRQGYDSLKKQFNVLSDSSAEVLFNNIAVGVWNIDVKAYGTDNLVKYAGTTEATITEGVLTNVYLTLQKVSTGVGSVSITITWGTNPVVSGLTHWWTGDSTANDKQGNSNGILQNGTTYAQGLFGQAFSFDGYDDVVTVSDPSLNFDTVSFSISVWVKARSFMPYSTIASKQIESGDWKGWWLGRTLELGGVWRFQCGSYRNAANVYSEVHADTGVFVNITAVVNRSEQLVQIYVNGILQKNSVGQPSTKSIGSINSPEPFRIGASALSSNTGDYQPWNGLVDQVKFYKKALTKEEVFEVYKSSN